MASKMLENVRGWANADSHASILGAFTCRSLAFNFCSANMVSMRVTVPFPLVSSNRKACLAALVSSTDVVVAMVVGCLEPLVARVVLTRCGGGGLVGYEVVGIGPFHTEGKCFCCCLLLLLLLL